MEWNAINSETKLKKGKYYLLAFIKDGQKPEYVAGFIESGELVDNDGDVYNISGFTHYMIIETPQ